MAKSEDDREVMRWVICFLRVVANLTQADYATAAGFSQGEISNYESGKRIPRKRNLQRMAAAAGVPWFLVGVLHRFFAALLATIRYASGHAGRAAQAPADSLNAALAPALAAVDAYRAEEEAAALLAGDPIERARREIAEWELSQTIPS
jgi:transcriptional regulator with XRE-family HTH domain